MKHLTQSFVLYLSHELLNLARKTQYHAKKIRIKNAVSGSFIFFQSGQNGKRRKAYNNPAYWSNYPSGCTNRSRNSAPGSGHGRYRWPGIPIRPVSFYRISYPIQGSDDYSTGWSLSLFCSNNKYKNSLLPQKNLSRKATCNWPLPSLRDSELYRWMNSGNGNSL